MIERRNRKPDKLTMVLRIAAILGWVAIFTLPIIGWQAAPETDFGIVRFHGLEVRDHWEPYWVQFMPFVLAACTLLSLLALGVSPLRSRRKSDPKRAHLLILLALTVVGYGLYWFQILGNTS